MTRQDSRSGKPSSRRRWGKRLAVVLMVMLSVLAVAFVWLSTLDVNDYRPRIEREISMRTGVPVTLGQMSLDMWPRMSIQVSDIALGGQVSEWMTVRNMSLTMPWSALLRGKLSFSELRLNGVSVELIREQDGRWNIDPMLDQFNQSAGDEAESSAELLISHLFVSDSRISLIDRSTGQGILASDWQLEANQLGQPPWALNTNARLGAEGSDIEASIALSLQTDWPEQITTTLDRFTFTLLHSSTQPSITFELPSPARLASDWTLMMPKWQLRRNESHISGSLQTASLSDFDPVILVDFESNFMLQLNGRVLPESMMIAPEVRLEGQMSISNDQGVVTVITNQLTLDQSPLQATVSLSLLDSSGQVDLQMDRLDLNTLLRSGDQSPVTQGQIRDAINLQWLEPMMAHVRVLELIYPDGRVSGLDVRLE